MSKFIVCTPIEYEVIDIFKDQNANRVGEALRYLSFLSHNGQLGCYESFDVASYFKKVSRGIYYKRAKEIILPNDTDKISCFVYHQDARKLLCIEETIVVLAWYWDGDGTLYFRVKNNKQDIELFNTDCKDTTYWQWVKE
jgi:hypothetical protein